MYISWPTVSVKYDYWLVADNGERLSGLARLKLCGARLQASASPLVLTTSLHFDNSSC